jgi:peptidoglycan/LPS O-acetylase OafA/YrhL
MPKVLSVVDRNSHLDLLRATAIIMVVFYHLIQMSPVPLPGLMRFANAGQYGVDLFFVLSGWLIGNLYWKEFVKFGDVQLVRFWSRRWLRTIPPYLVALSLAWLAVFSQRGEAFDWGYLAFVQNYYHSIPFFLVSWSLCIEEHFYLFIPLLLLWATRSGRAITILFAALILAAPIFRWVRSLDGLTGAFGYEQTATHLRLEGLLLGFLVAYVPNCVPRRWFLVQSSSPWVLFLSTVCFAMVMFLPTLWTYRIGFSLLALGFTGLLVFLVGKQPGRVAASAVVNWIAVSSYSVYLTHALMIHLARKSLDFVPVLPWMFYFPIAIGLIGLGGGTLYFAMERTSIMLRDRWVPRRKRFDHLHADNYVQIQSPNPG